MNDKIYEEETIIQQVTDIVGALVAFPNDEETEVGKDRVKVQASFDSRQYMAVSSLWA